MSPAAVAFHQVTREARQSPDGETASFVSVTRESSGWAVWSYTFEAGLICQGFYWTEGAREKAFTQAVRLVDHAEQRAGRSFGRGAAA